LQYFWIGFKQQYEIMKPIFPIYIALFFTIHLLIFLSSALRFRKWSESDEGDIVLGIPFLFVFFGTIGAILTVGIHGLFSWLGVPVLLFFSLVGKLKFRKPGWILKWHLPAFIFGAVFFLLKIFVLFDSEKNSFYCTFHDDYSYLSQINLLKSEGRESHFSELIRSSFNLEFQYKIYHLIEFYFVLFFKGIFGGTTYHWFHFFLKPILNVFAILSLGSFISSRYPRKGSAILIILISALFYSTLRFNLVDDFIYQLFKFDFLKGVFFQNYYFPAPLSYHVSYKISLSFIFLIPVFFIWIKNQKGLLSLIAVSALCGITSIAFIPFCALLFFCSVSTIFILKDKTVIGIWLAVLFMILCKVLIFIYQGNDGLARFVFSSFFTGFNLVFENFYWHFFYFSLFVLVFTRASNVKKSAAFTLLLFPCIYIFPSILFKFYALLIFSFLFYFIFRRSAFTRNVFLSKIVPIFIFLYYIVSFFPGIANLSQVYSNVLFLIICLVLLEFVFCINIKLQFLSHFLAIAFLLTINIPAIVYDNKTPLHREAIPENFFTDPIVNGNVINVLSVSEYFGAPYIDQYQLGQGLCNRLDNLAISMGGLENLDSASIHSFHQTGHFNSLRRFPAYQELCIQKLSIGQFLRKCKIKLVLVENKVPLKPYLTTLKPLCKRVYHEPERDYFILVLR
jgi:hypothetical protein